MHPSTLNIAVVLLACLTEAKNTVDSPIQMPRQSQDALARVQTLYNQLRSKGSCSNKLASGFYSDEGGAGTFSYCGDHLSDYNIVYIQGTNKDLANMDIDCDGTQGGPADDGRCGNSDDTQSQTSFKDVVAGYNKGIKDLNANVHPYVVFGNVGKKYVEFDPKAYGIQPLSVMAVYCNNKLAYGVWGDENGDDDNHPLVGEASISLATACFGRDNISGDNGHDEHDVLYLAFPGGDAVPGASGAKWNAANYQEFENSIKAFGDKLVQRIG